MITKELLTEINDNALKVALAKSELCESNFKEVVINDDNLTVVFSEGFGGGEDWVSVELKDLNKSKEDLENEHRIEIKEKKRLIKEKAIKDRKERKRIKKYNDYARFLSLKKQFEPKN